MKMVQRILYGQGVAINLELGFTPTYVKIMHYDATPTTAWQLEWFGVPNEEDTVIIAGGGIYGWTTTNGTVAEATADTGISSYDGAKTPQVLVDSPIPGKGDLKRDCFNFAYHKGAIQTRQHAAVVS